MIGAIGLTVAAVGLIIVAVNIVRTPEPRPLIRNIFIAGAIIMSAGAIYSWIAVI